MSKVVRKKKMMILWIITAVILLVTLWFNIPYSPFKNQFRKDIAKRCLLSEQSEGVGAQIVFSKEVFAGLPPLLQHPGHLYVPPNQCWADWNKWARLH